MQNLIINITQENFDLLQHKDFACFLLSDSLSETFLAEFINQTKAKEKLCLIYGKKAPEIYEKYLPDGVVFDLSHEEKPQKILKEFKTKNPKALIGAISRNRRHETMLISECEPEFIIFRLWNDGIDKSLELLEWYGEFFLIQYAVWPQEPFDFSKVSADFIIISDDEAKKITFS